MDTANLQWAQLLTDAVNTPGRISAAYSRFHNYSVGNQLLALFQCRERSIPLGPIATFPRWKELGRYVRKGQKALTLCMPVTCKRTATEKRDDGSEVETECAFTRFVYRPHWFVLAQTDGAEYSPEPIPAWSDTQALTALNVERIPFDLPDGNTQGFARERSIAISPIAALPHKTTFHELAHVVLGHTAESEWSDAETLPRSLREVEAECVALIACEALGLAGAEYSRGYIQSWLAGAEIPERSAQRIFHAADLILKAGRESGVSQ